MSEPNVPSPASDPWLPPPPPTDVPAWGAGQPPPERRRGRRAALIVGLGLVLAIVAGLVAYLVPRGGSGEETKLALAFAEGQTTSYRIAMTMDGGIEAGILGDQPMDMEMSETVSWRVTDVDEEGVATVELEVSELDGTVNGVPAPTDASEQRMTFRVAPDGQILSPTGISLGATGGAGFGGFPGMDQMTPILPEHPVAPGDSWDKKFSQKFPFGGGKIEYTSHSTFERYEDVDGARAALITTTYHVPLDFTLDLGDLAKAFGELGSMPSDGGADVGEMTIVYGGGGDFTQHAWLDLDAQEVVRTQAEGDFEMTMRITGVPETTDGLPTGEIGFAGTFTLEMQRL